MNEATKPTQEWVVEYEWTLEDMNRAGTHMMRSGSMYQKVMAKATFTALLCFAIAMIASLWMSSYFASRQSTSDSDQRVGFLLGLTTLGVLVVLAYRISQKAMKKTANEWERLGGLGKMPQQCRAWLCDEGVVFESSRSRVVLKWGDFLAAEMNSDLILVVEQAMSARGIPVRAFASQTDASAFYGEIVKRHDAAKRAMGA